MTIPLNPIYSEREGEREEEEDPRERTSIYLFSSLFLFFSLLSPLPRYIPSPKSPVSGLSDLPLSLLVREIPSRSLPR